MNRAKKNRLFYCIIAVAFFVLPWIFDGKESIPWLVVWAWLIMGEIWAAADWLLQEARGKE